MSMNVATSGRGVCVYVCVCSATVGWHLGTSVSTRGFPPGMPAPGTAQPATPSCAQAQPITRPHICSVESRFSKPSSCTHRCTHPRHRTLFVSPLKTQSKAPGPLHRQMP